MATALAQPNPTHPHGFLLHQHHHQSSAATSHHNDSSSVVVPHAPSQPTPSKPSHSDPYYGHEETARICARFIRHVFNCPADNVVPPLPVNGKPTESSIPLPKFVAYAFHRTRLPISVAFHSLYLLNRLKSRYPAASCAYGHRLFLTSYMLSSKVICDDTYSNKSWAIVGQGFYDLRDVNLMEREMIHYLSWDLTISGPDLQAFTERTRANYRKGIPKQLYVVIPDTSREKDMFGKGHIEQETVKKVVPLPAIPKSSSPYDGPPPAYSAHPPPEESLSPDSDSSSSGSSSSSRESSPPSPCLKTPLDDVTSSPGGALPGKPVPIDFSNHTSVQIHDVEREPSFGWVGRTGW